MRLRLRALAFGGLLLVVPAACTPDVGVFVTRAGAGTGGTAAGIAAEARALGVHTLRVTADLSRPSTLMLAQQLRSMGFDIVLTTRANDLGPNGATMPLDAAALTAFRTQLADAIDTVHPRWVMVENEETAPKFYAGTAAQYLDELRAAIDVGHAHGIRVTDGGITNFPIALVVWDQLRTAHDPGANDYLRGSVGRLGLQRKVEQLIADPSLLQTDPVAAAAFANARALITGFRGSGLDAADFHWYGPSAVALGKTVEGYNRLTDLPIVTTEIGQYDGNPATVTEFLDVLTAHHVRLVQWFDTDGDPAVGLHDAPGVLRPNGVAFADWTRTHR